MGVADETTIPMVRATGLCLLSTNAGVGVGDLDTESLGLLENVDALLGRDVVGDLGSVDTVVHEEELDVTDVGDHKAAVAVGHQVTGLLVGTVTDLGHAHGAAESAADGAVDTLGLAPRLADTVVSVRVVALERLGALLDDGDGGGSHLDNLEQGEEWRDGKAVTFTFESATVRLLCGEGVRRRLLLSMRPGRVCVG